MNQLVKIALLGLLVSSGSAMANQVTLENASKSQEQMRVVYEVAHQNNGQAPVIDSTPQTIMVSKGSPATIEVGLNGYQLAGIVPISIDGHSLPPDVNRFAVPEQCSMATDEAHPTGLLKMTYTGASKYHGKLTCSAYGGIFG